MGAEFEYQEGEEVGILRECGLVREHVLVSEGSGRLEGESTLGCRGVSGGGRMNHGREGA